MPNYLGKSPLLMECPLCGTRGEHPVSRTYPKIYHWSAHHVEFFQRIAGRNISYRKRTKQCISCKESFESVEMPKVFLKALIEETDKIAQERSRAKASIEAALKLRDEALDEIVRLRSILVEAKKTLARVV